MNKKLVLKSTIIGSVEQELTGAEVKLFVCGPTVYGPMHLGHGKTYTQLDFLATVLKSIYPSVRYVMNITDIDDKIINRAKAEETTSTEIAVEWENKFWNSMKTIGNTQVTEIHRATDFIPEIISQVERLIANEHAYVAPDNSVYFIGNSYNFPHGRLHKEVQSTATESRLSEEFLETKRSANDFVIWKSSKPGEPSWDSPWGEGRPGWHIEDTAITETIFGQSYDIHGGATDLIFPHHEAEIAQMEALSGIPLVDFWVHTGLLEVDGKKMGKSLHNFKILDELVEEWDWRTVRYSFLKVHYGSTMNLDSKTLEDSSAARQRIENYYRTKAPAGSSTEVWENFWDSILENLNTPKALAGLFEELREGRASQADIQRINEVLGGVFNLTEETTPDSILRLVAMREKARQDKQWTTADEFRKELADAGWVVRDTPSGPYITRV